MGSLGRRRILRARGSTSALIEAAAAAGGEGEDRFASAFGRLDAARRRHKRAARLDAGRAAWMQQHAALAQAARGVCKAARGVPWRRQCVALADACGVLDAAFGDGATDAVDDAAWRARFVDVWTRRRHKWRGGADPGGSFSIRAVVRFRPRLVAASETDHGGVFLPLHQRLQLLCICLKPAIVRQPVHPPT